MRSFLSACVVGLLCGMNVSADGMFGTLPMEHTIEVMWVQDFSMSYETDMKLLTSAFADVVEELKWTFPHSKFGLAGFTDIPVEPFGYPQSSDYCYQLRSKLTRATSKLNRSFQAAQIHSGGDWKESQLTALIKAAGQIQTGWYPDPATPNGYKVNRIVVMVTDSGFHTGGDGAKLLKANPVEDELINDDCAMMDYPTVEQVKDVLERKDVTPIFLVTQEVRPIYRNLVKDLGNRGVVVDLDSHTRNLRQAVRMGIKGALSKVSPGELSPFGRDDSIYASANFTCVGAECCAGYDCVAASGEAIVLHFEKLPNNFDLKIQ